VLFAVEISWFVLLPIYHELRDWAGLRREIRMNLRTLRTTAFVLLMLFGIIFPWRGRLTAPAILSAQEEQHVFAPLALIVGEGPAKGTRKVHRGDLLVRFRSEDLQQQIDRARISESVSRWQVEQQPFNEKMLQQGMILRRHLDETEKELSGRMMEKERLAIRAAFDGAIVMKNDEIQDGTVVAPKELLYVVAGEERNRVDAFVGMADIGRIRVGGHARFIPDAPEFGSFDCRVEEVDRLNLASLDEPALASTFGGPIAVRQNGQGNLIPSESVFRVRLNGCYPGKVPALRLRGTVGIDGEKKSLIIGAAKHFFSTMVRESGF
jgi:putative peptide zinc metalloprotease protein